MHNQTLMSSIYDMLRDRNSNAEASIYDAVPSRLMLRLVGVYTPNVHDMQTADRTGRGSGWEVKRIGGDRTRSL